VKARDLIFGIATLVVAILYYGVAATIPPSELADPVGPQGLPKTYAVLLAALSLLLIARSVRRPVSNPEPSSPESRIPSPGSPLPRVTGMLLIGIAYILVLPWNLRQEISSQLGYIRSWGGRLVFPIPELEIV